MHMLGNRLKFICRYFLFWMFAFLVLRLFFFLYNFERIEVDSWDQLALSFYYGMRMDASITSYFMFIVHTVLLLSFINLPKLRKWGLRLLAAVLLFVVLLIGIADMEIYRNWGFKMDASVLFYLKTPEEALASVNFWLLLLLLTGVLSLFLLFFLIYIKLVEVQLLNFQKMHWSKYLLMLLLSVLWFIPIRGGVGIAPMSTGTVYFSNCQFANHGAVNATWNFGQALFYLKDIQVKEFFDKDRALNLKNNLYTHNDTKPNMLLRMHRPNVVILVLESFTSKIVEPLGGIPGATPNFSSLAKEGILFRNCFASGDRSDKGLVAILSGFPAQPTTSIMTFSEKSEKLPKLAVLFNDAGYNSAFYYGGDIEFANMKSYFIASKYHKIVSLNDFSEEECNSKWGAHDEYVFQRLLEDMNSSAKPFFRTMFSLSSHEPFDVPHTSEFSADSAAGMFLNAAHYTDQCLGNFINKAKQESWWDSTLFIAIADHGTRHPFNSTASSVEKYKIPMLWFGGAIRKDTVIDAVTSQIDLPVLLCNELGLNDKAFEYSKNPLALKNPFAIFSYNNGFGYVDHSMQYVFDLNAMQFITAFKEDSSLADPAKAYIQCVQMDFKDK